MKKFYQSIFLAAAMALGASSLSAATMQQMRFHCANDTVEINALLQQGVKSGLKSPNALVSFYAHRLLGRPYVAHTLEGEREWLTIDIDEMDCTTFVETLYALARTTMNGLYSWRDYADNLESIRYRGGSLGDYSSRLHYISEWAMENISRGNLIEITGDLDGAKYLVKTLDFMTAHRNSYPAMKDSTIYEKVRSTEIGYRNHRFPYIRKEQLRDKKLIEQLESGDFVALVTKIDGLDVSHMGIIEKKDGRIYLLDASSIDMKVQLEKDDMLQMLRDRRNNLGIRVFRIREQ